MFSQHAHSHWLLRGHMTSNNETVSRQNLWAGNIAKSMTSEGNSALCTIRDFKIQQRVRQQERRLKSEFAFFQSL